jgi:DNA-binding SARP family transcriptional activator/basic membrane lipoprotein Med (substrate-binding protein (PBP1-ABC) superfamily)
MRYRILGAFEVERDGRVVALGGSRQRALLALLLLHRNQVVSVDRLVDGLWPEEPPKTAAQIVRVYVSQLRKELGGDALETAGRGYLLRVAPDHVDADRFEQLVAEGSRRLHAGDAGAAEVLREALALWRGTPLADLADEPFAGQVVARLDERRLSALEDLYGAELAAGRAGDLVAELDDLASSHPGRERLWAHLMLALYRSGRQAEALEAFRRARRYLVEELGLEPGEPLRRLEARVLRHDPGLDIVHPHPREPTLPAPRYTRPRLAIAGLSAVAVAAALVALVALHRSSTGGRPPKLRPITLAMFGDRPDPSAPVTALQDTIETSLLVGVREGVREGIRARVAYVGGRNDAQLERSLGRQARRSGLVIVGATPQFNDIAVVARRYPHTRFVLISASVHDARFPANVTGMKFDDHEVGYLAGYLGALEGGRPARISAVAGQPTPSVKRIVAGYAAGALAARADAHVTVGYTDTFLDQRACERMADRQIDAGSKVVFDVAGGCGFGALQAAGIRGVWGIGVDSDLGSLGTQILASSIKRIDSAVRIGMELYAAHRLPAGRDVPLDLGNDGVGLVGISDRVDPVVRDRLERVATALRARDRRKL